ncbi:MAG: exodeoxyribonuclease V subunit beta [Rhodocyclaceae bacterium]
MPEPLDLLDLPLAGTQLVEASAGTGKTWTNCGLYVRLVVERALRASEILVVTFTRAATAEIKARIRARLADMHAALAFPAAAPADAFVARYAQRIAAGAAPGVSTQDARRRIAAALAEFDEAAISTIHGFCQRALAEVPFAAGLPFAFEVVEDDTPWIERAAADFFRRRIACGGLDPAVVGEIAGSISPEALARALRWRLGRPLADFRFAGASHPGRFADYVRAWKQARGIWRKEREAVIAALGRCAAKPEAIAQAAREWDELLEPAFARLPGGGSTALRRLGRKACSGKRAGARPPDHPFLDAADAVLDLAGGARADLAAFRIGLLEEFLREAPDRVRAEKRSQRILAYDDMLYELYRALTDPGLGWLAGALARRHPAALIDEFQDTDPLQYAIFSAIYAKADCALFLVGDPKQSIYAFRHADLHTYLEAAKHAGPQRTHTLFANQRSVPGHIAATNALFGANPNAFALPGIEFRPAVAGERAHPALRDEDIDAPFVVWMLPPGSEGKPPGTGEAAAAAERATVAEILRLVAGGACGRVRIGERPLAAGDIAVIVRTHREAGSLRAALRAAGIAAVERGENSVFATEEAEALSRLIAALADPADTGALRAALATPLLGLSAADIWREAQDEAQSARRVAQFLGYRELWRTRGFAAAWRRLLADSGAAARLLAAPEGERALTNYLHLAELIHEAGRRLAGIDELARWYERQRREPPAGEAMQLRLESDEERVQIVTIHAAKGLEFPVVFCPFLWRPAGDRRTDGIEFHDGARAVVSHALEDRQAERTAALEEFAESLRLIYVALTRAVQRSYLVAGTYLHGRSDKACRASPLAWLVAGAGHDPERWLSGEAVEQADIESAWKALAAASHPAMARAPLPEAGAALPAPVEAPEHAPAPRLAHRILSETWTAASFTRLNAPGRAERAAAADHDEEIAPAPVLEPEAGLDADDPRRLPRGAAAGSLLHAVFERADFDDPSGWDTAIRAAMDRWPAGPQSAGHCASGEALAAVLRRSLREVAATDLDGEGLTLAGVPAEARLHELEFHFPADALEAGRFGAAIREAGFPLATLSFASLRGYVRGAIDCVLRHRGRFWLVDWKSNFLGWRAADYEADRIEEAIAREGYGLQAALYAVALHRYLRHRLPGYDCARDFGGILYVFVRGVRPDARDARGRPAGIWCLKPEADALDGLDRSIGAERGS